MKYAKDIMTSVCMLVAVGTAYGDYSEDFESYVSGSSIHGQGDFFLIAAEGGSPDVTNQTVTVAATGSPFGGGRQSMFYSDQNLGDSAVLLASLSPAGMSGPAPVMISFDFNILNGDWNPAVQIKEVGTQGIVLNLFGNGDFGGGIKTVQNKQNDALVDVSSFVISTGLWYRAEIAIADLGTTNDTYDLRILEEDGGSGTEVINVSGLEFANNVGGLDRFIIGDISSDGVKGGDEFYMDNIQVVYNSGYSEGFESYTEGSSINVQGGFSILNKSLTQDATVATNESFFGGDSQSLFYSDQDFGTTPALLVKNDPGSIPTNAPWVFSFDFNIVSSEWNPMFQMLDGSTTAAGVGFFARFTGKVQNFPTSGLVDVDSYVLSTGLWYRAEITVNDLSTASDTYDLRVIEEDGGSGHEVINVTGIEFRTDVSSVDGFLIGDVSSRNRGGDEFYIDNIMINNGVIAPATIVGWSSFSSTVMKMVVSTPDLAGDYYPKTTTDLVAGSWLGVAHSKDGSDPFTITNLAYSSTDGSNEVIYVKTEDAVGFFGIGGE